MLNHIIEGLVITEKYVARDLENKSNLKECISIVVPHDFKKLEELDLLIENNTEEVLGKYKLEKYFDGARVEPIEYDKNSIRDKRTNCCSFLLILFGIYGFLTSICGGLATTNFIINHKKDDYGYYSGGLIVGFLIIAFCMFMYKRTIYCKYFAIKQLLCFVYIDEKSNIVKTVFRKVSSKEFKEIFLEDLNN